MSVIIIDDADPLIVYSGSWDSSGGPLDYDQTASLPVTTGSELQLTFTGSEIRVYGTTEGTESSLTFKVDSHTNKTFTATTDTEQYHTNLFTQSGLSLDSPHTLVVTDGEGQGSIYVDYFLVTIPPTPNDTASNALAGRTIFIDDADSAVAYTGSWVDSAGTDLDLQGTLHGSSAAGANATLTFNGNQVVVYGSITEGTTGDIATFTVDSGASYTLTSSSLVPLFDNGVAANTQLFKAENLAASTHTLHMTAQGSDFFLDYVTVLNGTATSGTSSTPSSTSNNFKSSTPTTHLAAPIGGAIGGVVVLSLILGVFRRRQVTVRQPRVVRVGTHIQATPIYAYAN